MRLFSSSADDYYDHSTADFPPAIRALLAVVMAILWAFSKLMWHWSVEDSDKLFTREGDRGSVVICNHTSMAEVLPIVTSLYFSGRWPRPILKSEFAKSRIVQWAFSRAGGIPVERGSADIRALRRAQHALQRGEDVLIFPEGTRVRSDDQHVEVHGGFALIAQMGKADVRPLAVCGFRDITPEGKKLMRPMTCWLKAGDALSLDDAPEDMKRKERMIWLEHTAMDRVFTLRDGLRASHPGRF